MRSPTMCAVFNNMSLHPFVHGGVNPTVTLLSCMFASGVETWLALLYFSLVAAHVGNNRSVNREGYNLMLLAACFCTNDP